jgi:hypothetical protein
MRSGTRLVPVEDVPPAELAAAAAAGLPTTVEEALLKIQLDETETQFVANMEAAAHDAARGVDFLGPGLDHWRLVWRAVVNSAA